MCGKMDGKIYIKHYLVIDFIYLRKTSLTKWSEDTDLLPIDFILEDRESIADLDSPT